MKVSLFVTLVFSMSAVVSTHHSTAAYETTTMTLKNAIVKKLAWANPHSVLSFEVKDDRGRVVAWVAESGSPSALSRVGWHRNSVKAGDVITVELFPARNGARVARLAKIVLADGRELLDDANKATWGPNAVGLAESNDPLITCDPLGFPRSILYETRGFEFLHSPAKTVLLMQYQRVWREIWTDGRPLPSDVGGDSPTSPDPHWFGYSIGRWADDYTFVVETTGTDERSWVDYLGRPHSATAGFEERYRRVDRDTLEVTVTVTDPETYTRPYVAMEQTFVRANEQELEEQLCVPSEAIEYFKTVAEPAGGRR